MPSPMPPKQPRPQTSTAKNKRLNVRLLISLALATILLGAGIARLHRLQIKRNAGALIEQSNRAESKGDLIKAEEYLRLLLGYQPNHAAALAKFGLIRAARARTVDDQIQTIRALEQALSVDPDRRDVRRRLVEVAMSLKWLTVAQTHLETLLGRHEPGSSDQGRQGAPENGELEYLLGQCAEGQKDYAQAADWYKAAVAHAPQQIESHLRLADLLRNRLNDASAADRVMDAQEIKDGLIAANNRSPWAYLERARYRKQYQIKGADQDVARARELAPKDTDVLLTDLASAMGLERNPRNWRLSDAMASIARRLGQPREAEAYLRRGIDASADSEVRNRLLWALADVLIDEGKWSDAQEAIERLGKARVQPELLNYLDARIRVGEAKWIEASTELEAIYPLLLGKPALAYQADLLLGTCYLQLGDIDRRHAAFRRAVSLDPEGKAGQLGLAASLAAMERLDEALFLYRRLIDQEPTAGPAAARLLIQRNLRSPAARRDWREVEEILARSAQVLPGSTELIILRAEALVAQNQWDRAHDWLVKARDQRPDQIELWIALAELAERQDTPAAALSILDEAERRLGDRVELRVARSSQLARRGGADTAQALAELERDLASFSPSDQERLLRGLTAAHLRIGDTAVASRLISQSIRHRPFDLSLRVSQFDLALQVGDRAAMESILEGMRAIENQLQFRDQEGGAFWRCAKARLWIWSATRKGRGSIVKEELDEARLNLAEAGSRRPSWPLVPLAEAEIDDLVGNHEGAIKGYLRSIELGMHGLEVIRRAVQLLFERRRYDQADELIRKMQEQGLPSGDPRLQRLAAEVSLQAKDPARALDQARKAIPANSKDYRDHLWLGQILWVAGEPAQAEPELRRAVELAGNAPEPWITLVQYLARTGQKQQARAAMEQARVQLPGDQAPLALARCFAEVGDVVQARAQLLAALAARPDDLAALRAAASFALATGALLDAEAHLRKIIGLKSRAPDDADWARRLLAIVLASSGRHRQSLEALKLLNLVDEGASYLPAAAEPVDEIRAQAKVLSLRKNRDARRAAIRGLQHVIEREQPRPDDQYLLAQLYEADGNWSKAREQLRSLLAAHAENPVYLAHNTLILLRQGLTDEAQSWLDKLEKLEPTALRTLELKARLLKARGRAGEAVALLEALVHEKADQVGYVARLLEELGQVAAAEKLYRQFASRSLEPQAILVLSGFLGRRNRLAEALDLCEKAWTSCPPEAVAAATVAVLYSAPIDDAQCRRAAQSLERALRNTPRSAGLLFQLANIRSLEGRYPEAETLYRQSFTHDHNNSGPLTNLAWLRARRDGKGEEALKLLDQAMMLDGPAPDLLDTRAVAYLAMGRNDLAIKDLEDAVAVHPSPLKYLHLAEAYLMASRRSEATVALRSARTAGLSAGSLSPLERETCRRLLAELVRE